MKFVRKLADYDKMLATSALENFLPKEVFDIHAHPFNAIHFSDGARQFLSEVGVLGCAEHREALHRYMSVNTLHGLYFGLPDRSADRKKLNEWVGKTVELHGTQLSRALMVVCPQDNPNEVASTLSNSLFCGLKPYHCYAGGRDTTNAKIVEFAPEWMWEILHEKKGVLMLHIVRDDAISDLSNQQALKTLCRSYSGVKLILAHVARSFNYRNARNGLHAIADLDNVVVDTSAICEADAFRTALSVLGPSRILWGSDFPVSETRGRCVTTGKRFFWLYPELFREDYNGSTDTAMTLIGIESLLAFKEACEDYGLSKTDIDAIFLRNALQLLKAHLK